MVVLEEEGGDEDEAIYPSQAREGDERRPMDRRTALLAERAECLGNRLAVVGGLSVEERTSSRLRPESFECTSREDRRRQGFHAQNSIWQIWCSSGGRSCVSPCRRQAGLSQKGCACHRHSNLKDAFGRFFSSVCILTSSSFIQSVSDEYFLPLWRVMRS